MDLDDAYANGAHIEGADAYPAKWARLSEGFRAAADGKLDVSYGAGERHKFDLFWPTTTPKGLFVFVHGGYWLDFDKSWWSHLANGAVQRGWAVAMPSYDLCPSVRISDITRQVAAAIEAASKQVPGPIALAGHSAGGHLVARMVTPGGLPAHCVSRVVRVVPISPVADLRPLLRTSMNAQLGLDDAEATSESPVLLPKAGDAKVTVWVGAQERPAFLDQAKWLADAWGSDRMVSGGKHHFDVIDPLSDPESDMIRIALGD